MHSMFLASVTLGLLAQTAKFNEDPIYLIDHSLKYTSNFMKGIQSLHKYSVYNKDGSIVTLMSISLIMQVACSTDVKAILWLRLCIEGLLYS
jgi:hypothetical protein